MTTGGLYIILREHHKPVYLCHALKVEGSGGEFVCPIRSVGGDGRGAVVKVLGGGSSTQGMGRTGVLVM